MSEAICAEGTVFLSSAENGNALNLYTPSQECLNTTFVKEGEKGAINPVLANRVCCECLALGKFGVCTVSKIWRSYLAFGIDLIGVLAVR